MRIKAVLLDALQTVIDLDPSYPGAFARVCQDFGYDVSEAEVARIMPVIEQYNKERLAHEENLKVTNEYLEALWLKMNEFIFESIGIKGDARKLSIELERRFEAGIFSKVFPDTIPALTILRQAGLRLGIVSNGTASVLNCLRHHQLDKYVDFILISGIVGWEKPARQIYELALEKAQTTPAETVFVGDHYITDIEGARRMGIRPILIKRGTINHSLPSQLDCEVINSLLELPPLLLGSAD